FSLTAPPPQARGPWPLSPFIPTRSASGAGAGPAASLRWRIGPAGGASPPFPPLDRATITALACERVAVTQTPLSRQSLGDLSGLASAALGKPVSPRTVGRILDEDAIKPWHYQHWIFPPAAASFDTPP